MKKTLTIAGSDSCGGAGIQADIKTITVHGVYAMSAITALTAQNTTGVFSIEEVSPKFLKSQLDAVFSDIFPDSVKIGMISSADLIKVTAERLKHYNAGNIVTDPVMVSTSGSKLLKDTALLTLCEELFPVSALVTPNIPEAEILSGIFIRSEDDMIKAAQIICKKYRCPVLCKGGHSVNDSNDILFTDESYYRFSGEHISNPNTHGTGCTLSSAIAANLAKGFQIYDAVKNAKEFINGALSAGLDLGKGSGPLDHSFDIHSKFNITP